MSDDRTAVLETRARALAARPAPTRDGGGGDGMELATFVVDGETFALETRWVREVVPRGLVTPLPGAAPPLLGVTAWRGAMLGVRSLRALLGRPAGAGAGGAWLVVLGEDAARFALEADAPGDFARLPAGALRPAAGPYRLGTTDDAMMVLDGGALLRDNSGRRPECAGR